ncbi:hypothetical protein JX265_008750 [Neoarthrinium moseri]|uniref:Amine oxidase n=1 Tax=Neoarthrinium moseri TaxID=1658444 RepID=A0A9P9WHF4_9PEZI|nr:uncharacterized protein JN550_008774 [Neoarthrinium moseri]KAI1848468.1 hypothetical protein JX266_005774 [Neoarthrinium moseri]KAI1863533.1 hypothetical protein JX265_008750 [Neoarthrinium moseri]KAI1864487.1 hypothetical protein JN550_008774 [Neoarthrinium moseri]
MATSVDVLIIGAGLSGLQAALDVHDAGHSFTIIEARDRVGGKTYSVSRPDGKGLQEMGAAWTNDTNQSMYWSYCQKFGLTPVVQNIKGTVACEDTDGKCHHFNYGGLPNFAEAEVRNMIDIRDLIEATARDSETFRQPRRNELDQQTLEQWIIQAGAGPRAVQTVRLWTHGMLGQDPSDVSALAFLELARGGLGIANLRHDGKDGAQYLRLEEGTQAVAQGMAKLLPSGSIKLNCAANAVTAHDQGTKYTTRLVDGRTITSRRVIVSIPGPAYKNITFSPPLPPSRLIYTTAVRYGCYVKYICLFKTPFWRRSGACGLAQSFKGPLSHCRDTSVDSQSNYALTCFLVSRPGRQWYAKSSNEREAAILEQVSSLFGLAESAVRDEFIGSMMSPWMEDQWAGWGCPFAMAPPGIMGQRDDGQLITEPFGGMYFVGTELTNEWRGYMEGALRSGKRGAAQLLQDLRSESAKL